MLVVAALWESTRTSKIARRGLTHFFFLHTLVHLSCLAPTHGTNIRATLMVMRRLYDKQIFNILWENLQIPTQLSIQEYNRQVNGVAENNNMKKQSSRGNTRSYSVDTLIFDTRATYFCGSYFSEQQRRRQEVQTGVVSLRVKCKYFLYIIAFLLCSPASTAH